MKQAPLALALVSLLLSGCASTISAYKNRAVSKHGIFYKDKYDGGQVFVMSGERRLAVAIPENAKFKFCAEALPDVAAAFGAASSVTGESGKTTVGFTESTAMGLLQTFNRTENAELMRTWGFLSCLAQSQGFLQDANYKALFEKVTIGMVEVMKSNATSTRVLPGTGGSVTIVPGATAKPIAETIPTTAADEQKKKDEQQKKEEAAKAEKKKKEEACNADPTKCEAAPT